MRFFKATILIQLIMSLAAIGVRAETISGCLTSYELVRSFNAMTLEAALAYPKGVELTTVGGKKLVGTVQYHKQSNTYFVGGKPVPREAIGSLRPIESGRQTAAIPPPVPDHVLKSSASRARVARAKTENSVSGLLPGIDIPFAEYIKQLEKELLAKIAREKLASDTIVEGIGLKQIEAPKKTKAKNKNLDEALDELYRESGLFDEAPKKAPQKALTDNEVRAKFFNPKEHAERVAEAEKIAETLDISRMTVKPRGKGYISDGFKIDLNGETIDVSPMYYEELLSENVIKTIERDTKAEAYNSGRIDKIEKSLRAEGYAADRIDLMVTEHLDDLLRRNLMSALIEAADSKLGIDVGKEIGSGSFRAAFRNPYKKDTIIKIYMNFKVIDGRVQYRDPESMLSIMQRDVFAEKVSLKVEEKYVRAGRKPPWKVAMRKDLHKAQTEAGKLGINEYELAKGKSVREKLLSDPSTWDEGFMSRLDAALAAKNEIDAFIMAVHQKRWGMALSNMGPKLEGHGEEGILSAEIKQTTRDGIRINADGHVIYTVGVDTNNGTNSFDDGEGITLVDE